MFKRRIVGDIDNIFKIAYARIVVRHVPGNFGKLNDDRLRLLGLLLRAESQQYDSDARGPCYMLVRTRATYAARYDFDEGQRV